MIRKLKGRESPVDAIFPIAPDRPKHSLSISKLLFFFLREGTAGTLKKISSKLFKYKKIDNSTLGALIDGRSAISFDGGKNFYQHSTGPRTTTEQDWYSPFESDFEVEPSGLDASSSTKVGSLFLFGAGDYAQTYTLKHFGKSDLFFAVDYSDTILNSVRSKFSNTCNTYSSALPAWSQANSPVAIVATYHSDHARHAYALATNNSNGFIFVEKPPLVDYKSEFPLYKEMYAKKAKIEIGFNRRYAPATKLLVAGLEKIVGPTFINISVNEVKISTTHWYHWRNQGTRITGNSCHWIDLCQFIIRARPTKLTIASSPVERDNVTLVISYEDGSLANMIFSDRGSTLRGVQESIEVKRNDNTFLIDDFLTFRHDSNCGRKTRHFWRRDKGHDAMYADFKQRIDCDVRGYTSFRTTYPLEDLATVARVTFEFSRMLQSNFSVIELT